MQLTIFTPTYNRERTIKRLFESLLQQEIQDFVWDIIDDGSTDETEGIINDLREEAPFLIQYKKRNNGGKYSALVDAIQRCKTELFICIDSDDYISSDCIKILLETWNVYGRNNNSIVGVVCPRAYTNGHLSCRYFPETGKMVTMCELSDKYRIKGETLILLRTDYLKTIEYPYFKNEKFTSEEIIYNQLDIKYRYITLNRSLCYMKYLNDGLTKNLFRNWISSPKATNYMLRKRYEMTAGLSFGKSFLKKIKTIIFQICVAKARNENMKRYVSNYILSFFLYPIACIFYYRRKYNEIENEYNSTNI